MKTQETVNTSSVLTSEKNLLSYQSHVFNTESTIYFDTFMNDTCRELQNICI